VRTPGSSAHSRPREGAQAGKKQAADGLPANPLRKLYLGLLHEQKVALDGVQAPQVPRKVLLARVARKKVDRRPESRDKAVVWHEVGVDHRFDVAPVVTVEACQLRDDDVDHSRAAISK